MSVYRWVWYGVKYLYLSELGAFLLIHFRHLGFSIRVISDGVEVALIFWARAPVIIITVLVIPLELEAVYKKG